MNISPSISVKKVLNALLSLKFCLNWKQFRDVEIRNMSEFQVCSVKAGYWGTREFLSGIPRNTTTEHCGIPQNKTLEHCGIQLQKTVKHCRILRNTTKEPQNKTSEHCGIQLQKTGL